MAGYVFIGDDFTGASDTLATIAERGHRARLFLDVPAPGEPACAGLNAIGIATDLRALDADAIAGRIRAMGGQLKKFDAGIVHYKVCSTFDSSPSVGSIGSAVMALEEVLEPALTVIVGGQPSLGRYCHFGNLFARGPDGAVHRIDRHPIMSRHPTTPMDEADLRLHLAAQGLDGIELEPSTAFANGAAALKDRLRQVVAVTKRRVLLDAACQGDLDVIGEALHALAKMDRLLVVGASSVAEAIFAREHGKALSVANSLIGPVLAVVGSRSSTSAAQVGAAVRYNRLGITPELLSNSSPKLAEEAVRLLRQGQNVLLHLVPEADYGLSHSALSERLALLTEKIANAFPLRALAIAGGDTSSVISRRLGFGSLDFESRLGAGVCVCRTHASNSMRDGVRLLLKGGQVGSPEIFNRFV
jgi:uncharacterized protein YgbK (DUF1537 family)